MCYNISVKGKEVEWTEDGSENFFQKRRNFPLTNPNKSVIIKTQVKELKKKGNKIMTQRDFYNAVIATVDNDELKAFATDAIAKLDERNAKRASKESAKQIANKPIVEAIARVLTDEPMLASKIAELCEISTQKASALVKKVEGVQSVDVKVKGKGTQKGYFLA